MELVRPDSAAWRHPETYWAGLDAATAELDPPFGALDLAALSANAFSMIDRAGGLPLRVASKSVRVRAVLDAVLALPGYSGVLAYTLPEALWLAETIDDVVMGYPTANREAIRRLVTDPELARRVTLMVDSVDHLDAVDAVLPADHREEVRVAIELDVSLLAPAPLGRVGVWRSPVRTAEQARQLGRHIVERGGFRLVGLMGYEAQVAGLVNNPASRSRGVIVRALQRRSMAELSERRGAAVAALRELTDLEFVNGGGTGSIEVTAADDSVTEIAAGSGLFGPHLFDNYAHFSPAPAAAFALGVVRKPTPDMAVLMGGGWIASGPPGADRAPEIAWPRDIATVAREGFGEVQTPLTGAGARALRVGDRAWLRHTKAGELSEHLREFAVIEGGSVRETVPTYRGEGKVFL